jgi:hypothetical protein
LHQLMMKVRRISTLATYTLPASELHAFVIML